MRLTKLFKWLKPYKLLICLALIFSIVNPLTYSYVPQFIKYVIDVVLKETKEVSITLPSFLIDYYESFTDKLTIVTVVAISLVIYQLIRGLMMFTNGYVKGLLGEKVMLDMRTSLYDHIQKLSYKYHNNVDAGDLIQRCTSDVETIKTFLSTQLPEIIYIFISIIAGAIQMSVIDVRIMLVTLIILPVSFISSFIYFKYTTKKFEIVEENEANLTSVIQENVNGVRVVKAFNAELDEIKRFDIENEKVKKSNDKLNNGMAVFWSMSDLSTFLQYALTVFVCILFGRSKIVSTGDIIACMMYIGMLVWPIRNLGRIIADFGKATVSANRIDEILTEIDEYQENGKLTPKISGKIEFQNVSFKFDDSEEELFKNLSFTINRGETVAFVGRTGSGKSTIANLLVRMFDITGGKILIDGTDIKDIEKHHLRKSVGILLQEPFLYTKTIMENIRIANPKLTEEDVYKVAKIASIHDDINEFELKYNTLVGEKGVTLSGGQKQRIAIARMLVMNKPIIIFDDSLSAVDTKTDAQIRKALKENKEKLTSIIITHRITTAKEADKIIVLNNKTIEAVGTHEELVEKSPLYKSLWDIQGSLESEFTKLLEGGE